MSIASDEWMVAVARRLAELVDEVVFVGGAILGALIDDIGAAGVRQTDDLDVIVDARSRLAYDAFGRKLMRLGFHPDTSEDVSGHLAGDLASQARRPRVLDRLRQIARR